MYTTSNNQNKEFKNSRHLSDTFEEAGRKVRAQLHIVSKKVSGAADSAKGHVRAHPMQTTLIALGAGYVLGKLLRR